LVCLAMVAASAPPRKLPVFEPDAELRVLREAAAAEIAAVNVLLSAPVEVDRVPVLSGMIDDLAAKSAAARDPASALAGRAAPADGEMQAALRGGRQIESLDELLAARRQEVKDERERWSRAVERKERLEQKAKESPELENKALVDAAQKRLAAADAALKD